MNSLSLKQRSSLQRFFRGLGAEAAPILLNRRRIFILPTKHGFLFALLLLLLLLGSMNYNNSLGFALTFLLASLGNLGILSTYRNLSGLEFSLGKKDPCFAGDPLSLSLLVSNHSTNNQFSVMVESNSLLEPARFDIAANETKSVTVYIKTQLRGQMPIPRFTLSTKFPLNLFRAWAYVHFEGQCLVFPRPLHLREPIATQTNGTSTQGDRGRGADDFAGFRHFQIGDSPRLIYWKKSTHEQNLISKQFGGDHLTEHWFDARQVSDLPIEKGISQLCQWILRAEQRHEAYGLRLVQQEIPIGSGYLHQQQCLTCLALLPHG